MSHRRCLSSRPTALVGVATVGGRFPPAWRELLRECVRHGIGIDNGLHEFIEDDPELAPLAAASGATLRDLRRPPVDLEVATGANLEVPGEIVLTVGSDCAIGKMTVSLELAREAVARGISASVRPDRPDGDRDRRLGHLGRRRRRRLHRRRRRAARRRGRQAWGRSSSRRGPGLSLPPWLLGSDARSHARVGASCIRPVSQGRRDRDRRVSRPSTPLARRSRRLARAGLASVPAGRDRVHRSQHAAPRRRRGSSGDCCRRGRRRGSRPTIRCDSAPVACSMHFSSISDACRVPGRFEDRGRSRRIGDLRAKSLGNCRGGRGPRVNERVARRRCGGERRHGKMDARIRYGVLFPDG